MRNPQEHIPLSDILSRLSTPRYPLTAQQALNIRNSIEDTDDLDDLADDHNRVWELANPEEQHDDPDAGRGDITDIEALRLYDNDATDRRLNEVSARLQSLGYEYLEETPDHVVYAAFGHDAASWKKAMRDANREAAKS